MLDLVDLRLLERLRALAPVPARVHHQRAIEPKAVEVGPKAVVRAGIQLGALAARIRAPEFVPAVRLLDQRIRRAESAAHSGAQRGAKIAFDIHIAVEVSIEQTDVAKRDALQLGGTLVKPQR